MKKIILLTFLLCSTQVYAVDKNPIEFETPEQEERYSELIKIYRCVVCQNQAVSDSNAELAQDIRDLVRNKVLEGQTEQQITNFLVERYGDFVLYDPPLEPKTYVLWIAPIILVLLALLILIYFIRYHTKTTAVPSDLTPEEQDKLKQALTGEK
ncbi:MAG: cytochrome c-type biogenesis protein CcmH [Thiomargarita sp.]|nr:cytochrome c-type biogenesis protein CcmH [Thiomargarita sp.]